MFIIFKRRFPPCFSTTRFQESPQVGVRATHGVVESGRWAFCVDF